MKHANFVQFCAENGFSSVVSKELRQQEEKRRLHRSHRYTHPPAPAENPVNDRRDYYRKTYLKSDHWKALRASKLKQSPCCEKCGAKHRLDVHHLDYKNLYDVTLEDLMTLCRRCHEAEHKCVQRARAGG